MDYIKKHAKQIITTFIFSIILAYLLSLNRPYPTFGGENLIPIATIFYWIFKYLDEKDGEQEWVMIEPITMSRNVMILAVKNVWKMRRMTIAVNLNVGSMNFAKAAKRQVIKITIRKGV